MKIEDSSNVPMAVIAQLFGFTTRHGNRLANQGIIYKVKRGRYDLEKSIKRYIEHLTNSTAESGDIAANASGC